jgi:hypothetical protein
MWCQICLLRVELYITLDAFSVYFLIQTEHLNFSFGSVWARCLPGLQHSPDLLCMGWWEAWEAAGWPVRAGRAGEVQEFPELLTTRNSVPREVQLEFFPSLERDLLPQPEYPGKATLGGLDGAETGWRGLGTSCPHIREQSPWRRKQQGVPLSTSGNSRREVTNFIDLRALIKSWN